MESATKRIASEAPDRAAGLIELDQIVVGPGAARPIGVAVANGPDSIATAVARGPRTDPAAVVLPTGNATGREWSEWPFPPSRWMGGSNCGRDV